MNFSAIKIALILAPHPDDEALGCGGTMARLISNGISLQIAYLTAGERLCGEPSEEIARIRKEEARKACHIVGSREPLFLNLPDGELDKQSNEIFRRLEKLIETVKPDIVLSPSLIDYHRDHIATARAILQVMTSLKSFKLVFYEVYETIRFNSLIDISDFIEHKKRTILNYKKSLYERPELYVHSMLGLNAQRSIYTERAGYYEAFLTIDDPVDEKDIYDYLCYRRDVLT